MSIDKREVNDLKVIFIPDYRNMNPYQKNLADSLSKYPATIHFAYILGLFAILKTVMKYWKPHVLHIHWPHPYIVVPHSKIKTILQSIDFIFELSLLKLTGIKIIWTVHNIADHEEKFMSLELFFTKLLAKICNKLIIHCPSVKKEIMRIYRKRESSIAVIHHGNYINSYENKLTPAQAREKLNLRKNETIFLYFGQIRPYKGVMELIGAFENLNCQNARLLIVGKPLDDQIALEILDRCKGNARITNILTFIPDNDIQIYMNAADVIVMPYRDILTSGVAISALSFGKPIIAPAIGCIRDILDDKGSFLYSGKSNLFDALQCSLNTNPMALSNMGKHNFELAKGLSWDEIGKETYNVYQEYR